MSSKEIKSYATPLKRVIKFFHQPEVTRFSNTWEYSLLCVVSGTEDTVRRGRSKCLKPKVVGGPINPMPPELSLPSFRAKMNDFWFQERNYRIK